MTEARFTRDVGELAGSMGLLWHHCGDSRRCQGNRGFPDLVIAGEHGILPAELKMPDGETSAGQDLWAWTISQAGLSVPVYHPADLESGRIRDDFGRIR
jgi:hypothetical protein